MALFQHNDTTIHFEERGDGFPLLLIAPGGMDSTIDFWPRVTINPLVDLSDDGYRLIAMDQRNSGESTGPLDEADPWGAYAQDQLALLDHLGIERCLVFGCCVGGSYVLKLTSIAPERIAAAVLEQPIGITADNAQSWDQMWRAWGARLLERRPDLTAEAVERFGTAMWGEADFVVSVDRDLVRSCQTSLLVLPGIDDHHPGVIGHEIAALAPHAEIVEPWKDTPEDTAAALREIQRFLALHAS